jgi:hypothetical protein
MVKNDDCAARVEAVQVAPPTCTLVTLQNASSDRTLRGNATPVKSRWHQLEQKATMAEASDPLLN